MKLLWRCVADKLVARLHVKRQIDPVISLLVAKRTYRADVRDRKRCEPSDDVRDRMHITETGSGVGIYVD